ncbi:MAG: PAS domain S-box protein [Desulfobacterales bacterium]|nr:PAS domain S-box protein [Desulfobacteraceae bacterium]MBT7084953.1 PAS domain S-box protein [Desulfobacterales bacterium]MBT7697882.1 PAS domain S-box protein [Desulfobacterales bacterium]
MIRKPTYQELEERIKNLENSKREYLNNNMNLLETISDGVIVLDYDFRCIMVNEAACKFMQLPKEKILNNKPFDVYPGIEGEPFYKNYENVMKNRQTSVFTNDYTYPDGRREWYQERVHPIPEGILMIITNITESKNSEEKLKKLNEELHDNERKYRLIVENINDVVWAMDDKMSFNYLSPASEKLLGWPVEEVLNRKSEDFLTKSSFNVLQKKVSEHLAECKKSGDYKKPIVVELEMIKTDKSIIWTEVKISFKLDKRGYPIGVYGVTRDINERIKSQKALKESEERLNRAQSAAGIGSFEYDISTGKFWGSEEAFTICGIERSSSYFTRETALKIINDNSVIKKAMSELISEEKKYDIEFEIRQEIGGETAVCRSIAELVFEDAKPVKVIGVIIDITEQKKAGKIREALEAQLQHAQKMEAIGTLAGGIAHDFNNILFPIVGFTGMMISELPDDSPYQDYLSEIYNASLRAKDLVKHILSFSRQTDQEKSPVKIQYIIKEVLSLSRSTLPSTIKIRDFIHNNSGMIMADPTQIHQIVMNLITNAFHAMEDEGGTLTISLKEVEFASDKLSLGTYACITVIDTGTGIENSFKQNIFDPYFTTKKSGKGTGLGLAVVHSIVESYKGEITVQSELGVGTEFNVYLPIILPETVISDTITPVIDHKGNERILVVDDDEAVAQLIKKILERLGYKITIRYSSLDALEFFRIFPDRFDLIITDMTMPNMCGDILSIEIKKIRPDIPIILCTGFSEKVTTGNSTENFIDKVLLKPILNNELMNIVRNVLDN